MCTWVRFEQWWREGDEMSEEEKTFQVLRNRCSRTTVIVYTDTILYTIIILAVIRAALRTHFVVPQLRMGLL
jgi:hypothetical protein